MVQYCKIWQFIYLFFFLAILIWSHGLVDLTGERKRKMYRLQQHRSVWIFPLTDSMPLKMAFSTLLELKPCCLTHCYSLNHIIAFNIDWSWNIFSLHNFCSMLIEQLLDHRKVRTVNLKFSQKIFIDSFYWNLKLAFKHCFSFATFLAAKLVAIDSELWQRFFSKLLCEAIWICCAAQFMIRIWADGMDLDLLLCTGLNSGHADLVWCNMFFQRQWMIARFSDAQAMGTALVCNKFLQVAKSIKFSCDKKMTKKMLSVTCHGPLLKTIEAFEPQTKSVLPEW